jgi:hypothetical protein
MGRFSEIALAHMSGHTRFLSSWGILGDRFSGKWHKNPGSGGTYHVGRVMIHECDAVIEGLLLLVGKKAAVCRAR